MVVVPVRVRDNKRDQLTLVPAAPLGDRAIHNLGNVRITGASILEQRALLAEEKIQKWLFIVGAPGFAQDI